MCYWPILFSYLMILFSLEQPSGEIMLDYVSFFYLIKVASIKACFGWLSFEAKILYFRAIFWYWIVRQFFMSFTSLDCWFRLIELTKFIKVQLNLPLSLLLSFEHYQIIDYFVALLTTFIFHFYSRFISICLYLFTWRATFLHNFELIHLFVLTLLRFFPQWAAV